LINAALLVTEGIGACPVIATDTGLDGRSGDLDIKKDFGVTTSDFLEVGDCNIELEVILLEAEILLEGEALFNN
jgi:hypothetical protein